MESSVHWARVKEIFTRALDQSPHAREAFARQACGSDEVLLQDILRLLASHEHSSQDLSWPLLPAEWAQFPEQPPRFELGMVLTRRFQIIRLIARGGMGDVYEAQDLDLHTRVALKTIRPDIAADPRVLDLFKNEIQIARRVTHPNVCRIYDLAQHAEAASNGGEEVTLFLTMELLEGQTLTEWLKAHGPFSHDQAVPLIAQLASALQAAHQAGVIHRDLKPSNVMLVSGPDGHARAVVTDFGLALACERLHSQSLPRAAGGTPAYMAPEQARGDEATAATDIYAFGLVIAQMISGRVPKSRDDLALPGGFRPWEPVLRRCLDPDPARRYSRPIQISEALSPSQRSATKRKKILLAAAALIGELDVTELFAHPAGPPLVTPHSRGGLRTVWIGLALALPLFAGAWSLFRGTRLPAPYVTSATTEQGVLVEPVLSPDGRRLAYAWDGDKAPLGLGSVDLFGSRGFDIYVKLIGSPNALRLTTKSGLWPAWSPDGSQIAFWRQSAIYVVSSLGGVERKLADVPGPRPLGRFSWSADGKWIAIAQQTAPDESNGIFLISTDGRQRRRLTREAGSAFDWEPTFSPNGKRLAYNACLDSVCTLSLLELDDDLRPIGPPRLLNAGRLFRSGLAWSSDSQSILYDRRTPHWNNITDRLWRIGIHSGSRPQRLDYTDDGARSPSTSKIGERLVYERAAYDSDVWKWRNGEARKLIASTKVDESAQYSPDGRKIVFSSNRSGSYEIWVADADGSNQAQLTFSSIASGSPTWSRDAKWIAYDGLDTTGQYRIFVISADGGPPRQVTRSFSTYRPRFSHDGNWIYCSANTNGIQATYRVPFAGGEPVLLIKDGRSLSESWDGTSFYYVMQGTLYIRPLAGGQERKVAEVVPDPNTETFAVAREGIYYLGPANPSGSFPLEFLDPATSRTRHVTDVQNPGNGLSVSPDGSIAYTVYSGPRRADLRLVEHFR